MPRINSLLRPAPRWVEEKPTLRASSASVPATPSGVNSRPSIRSHCPGKCLSDVSRLLAWTMRSSGGDSGAVTSTGAFRETGATFFGCCSSSGAAAVRIRADPGQFESAQRCKAVQRLASFHPSSDRWSPALQKFAIRDGNADPGLPADGERRLPDRPWRDIDRIRNC